MTYEITTLLIFAGIALLLFGLLIIVCLKRYEVAVFLVAISPLIATIFLINAPGDALAQEESIGSYVRISLLLFMGFVGFIKYIQYQLLKFEKLPLQIKLFGIFLIIALASTAYSIDPFYTFIRSLSFVALFGFLIGLYVWLNDDHRVIRVLNSLYYLIFIITIANALSLIFLGEQAWWIKNPHRFIGLWGHPNTMGAFCMISYPVVLWKFSGGDFRKKWLSLILIIIIVVLHILTGSRTSILAAVFGVGIWFFVLKQKIKPIIIFSLLTLIGVILIETTAIEESYERSIDSEKSVTTLTGRTEFWSESFQLIKEKPLQGYGFGVAGKILSESELFNPDIRLWSGSTRSSLHSGYIAIASGVGIFGFIIWGILLVIPLWRSRGRIPLQQKAFVMTTFLICLLVNFVEDSINAGSSMTAIFFWIAWIMAGKGAQIVGRD